MAGRSPQVWTSCSAIETDNHNVAVLDQVGPALDPLLPRLDHGLLALERDQVLIADHFHADETFFHVRVDLARSHRGGVPLTAGPDVDLLLPRGEKVAQAEQSVPCADQSFHRRGLES